MAFIDLTTEDLYSQFQAVESKYFSSQFFKLSERNTLIGFARTLVKFQRYHQQMFKARPYDDIVYYTHLIAFVDYAMQPSVENKDLMNTVFDELPKLLELIISLQYTPALEEYEEEE